MTLTPSTLTDIEQKAKAATPGPWRQALDGSIWREDIERVYHAKSRALDESDLPFICAANPSAVLAMVARIRQLESLAAERYEDAEAAHARLGEPYQPGATTNALRNRIRQLEAALVEACDMLGGYVSDRQFPARYADHDADRLASLRAIAGAGK